MQITIEQKKKIEELEAWFEREIIQLKRKELEIMKRYDERRSQLLRKQLLKKANDF